MSTSAREAIALQTKILEHHSETLKNLNQSMRILKELEKANHEKINDLEARLKDLEESE